MLAPNTEFSPIPKVQFEGNVKGELSVVGIVYIYCIHLSIYRPISICCFYRQYAHLQPEPLTQTLVIHIFISPCTSPFTCLR